MSMKIIVLGAGLVGRPMAIDLSKDSKFEVSIADINELSLKKISSYKNIKTICKDLSISDNVKQIIKDFDFVVNAVPGFMGFNTLKAIIEAKKNVVDITFFPEDLFLLNDLAKKNNVIVVSDIGVAPGMSNILSAYADNLLDKTYDIKMYVGGLPKKRELPYEYKAVFSPADVIEEYTRTARFVRDKKIIVKPALSDVELMDFPEIGTLEAFNSDGLRTLINTVDAPNMIEKTLRYPGHVEKMKLLKDTGFFSKEEIEINNTKIAPLDFTSKLLFPKWELKEGEEDITIMRIIVEGEKNGEKTIYTFDLYDEYDKETKIHSMARCTGYTATTMLRMIVDGVYTKKGISAPEYIGLQPECVEYLLQGLKERGVVYRKNITSIK